MSVGTAVFRVDGIPKSHVVNSMYIAADANTKERNIPCTDTSHALRFWR